MMELLSAYSTDPLPADTKIASVMAHELKSLEESLEDFLDDYHPELYVVHIIGSAELILEHSYVLYAHCLRKYGSAHNDIWKTPFLELQGTIETAVRYLQTI